MNGDIPSTEWYLIKGYDGFKQDQLDKDALWQGANDISDPNTYSEPTKLINLSRYNYAKRKDISINPPPQGIIWSI